jgi:hypothetical protein
MLSEENLRSHSDGKTFPWKLHRLLESTEHSGRTQCISWLPDGKSFKVHDKVAFTSEILPTFFQTSKFKSFQRNLSLWGFHTISKGPSKGVCSHPDFLRGLTVLCYRMERVGAKSNRADREQENDSKSSSLTPQIRNQARLGTVGEFLPIARNEDETRRISAVEQGDLACVWRMLVAKTQPQEGILSLLGEGPLVAPIEVPFHGVEDARLINLQRFPLLNQNDSMLLRDLNLMSNVMTTQWTRTERSILDLADNAALLQSVLDYSSRAN